VIGKHVRDQGDVRLTFTPHPGVGDDLTFIHLMEYIWATVAGEAMATIPTPEETALKILDIFKHFNCRPGNVLDRLNFTRKIAAADFAPGMEFAAQQGWVEVLSGGSSFSFKLTAAGFAKA
jgi:hypothetical protein